MSDFLLTGKTRMWFKRIPRKLKKAYKKQLFLYPNTKIRSFYLSPAYQFSSSTIITNEYKIKIESK